ncbi:MAG TPA: hypothetical protein PLZ93_07060, partial [Nocardioides sp.]|nr:hypothetical protein [Nocardioides sp.]
MRPNLLRGKRRQKGLDGGHRTLADEAAADVRRGLTTDRSPTGQQGYVVARAVRLDDHRAGVLARLSSQCSTLFARWPDDRDLERTAGDH